MKKEYIYILKNNCIYKKNDLKFIDNMDNIYHVTRTGDNVDFYITINLKENGVWKKLTQSFNSYISLLYLIKNSYNNTIILQGFHEDTIKELFKFQQSHQLIIENNQENGLSRTFNLELYKKNFSHLNNKK